MQIDPLRGSTVQAARSRTRAKSSPSALVKQMLLYWMIMSSPFKPKSLNYAPSSELFRIRKVSDSRESYLTSSPSHTSASLPFFFPFCFPSEHTCSIFIASSKAVFFSFFFF